MKINDILNDKGAEIVTISPDATVRELVGLLAQHNIGALVVSRDGSTLDGIVSERDIVRHLYVDGLIAERPVSSIMTSEVATCQRGSTLEDVRGEMTTRRIRHLPVVEDGSLVGIVSIGDIVKSTIGQLEFERDQLSSYMNQ